MSALKLLMVVSVVMLAGCYPEEWADVSPDGKSLVVSSCNKGVFWLNVDGTQAKRLADAGWCPKFSPDGKSCVFTEFVSEKDGREDFVLYDLASGKKEILRSLQLKKGENVVIFPAWKPDGKMVAYTIWRLEKGGDNGLLQYTELHVLDIDAKSDSLIRENVGIYGSWSPDGGKLAYTASEAANGPLEEKAIQLGSLEILEADVSFPVAGILFNPYAQLSWMSNDKVLFGAVDIALPASTPDKEKMREASYIFNGNGGDIKKIGLTEGMSWKKLSSCIRLSPAGDSFLFGTHDGSSPEITIWRYDFADDKKTKLFVQKSEVYPFWVTKDSIGYFEGDDHIVIAEMDDEGQISSQRNIDLTPVFDLPSLSAPDEDAASGTAK